MAEDSKSTTTTTTTDSEESDESIEEIPKFLPELPKKRRNPVSVCLTNCRYNVVRRVCSKFGYKEVNETDNWNFYWTDLQITIDLFKDMKRFQKINHFPGMMEISRKDMLARNLNRMYRMFPQDYNIFPRTWCLPADLGDVFNYSRVRKNRTFILKPDAGSQGKGIYLTKTLKDIRPSDRGICQVYITKPFLIDDYKFDLRIYVLITSCDPLRIYIYEEGLVRFATMKYKEPNLMNANNVFMHLTNYSVNKYSQNYNQDVEQGTKRRLTWFKTYIEQLGHDINYIWKRIDDVIIKTIISACPILKHSYLACFPNHDVIPACCELLGVDIILDKHLKPYILEVNHSPSFHTDTPLDKEIKESLFSDMFAMLNLESCNKRKIIKEDRKRIRERLIHGKDHPNTIRNFDRYFDEELSKCGEFRLVYPTNLNYYNKFFEQQCPASMYCDTIASKAREAAQNALREEIQLRAKVEAAKRFPPAIVKSKRNLAINSSEPQRIIEAEERKRLQRLIERENLLKTHGIFECVYFAMKQNGNLRPRDERKFGFLEKLANVNGNFNSNTSDMVISDLVESITKPN